MAIDSDDSEFKEGDVVVQIGCEETSVIQGRDGDDYIAYSENEYGRHTYGMKVSYMDKHYVKVGRVDEDEMEDEFETSGFKPGDMVMEIGKFDKFIVMNVKKGKTTLVPLLDAFNMTIESTDYDNKTLVNFVKVGYVDIDKIWKVEFAYA